MLLIQFVPPSPSRQTDFTPYLLPWWGQCRRPGFDPWVWKILWRRKWQLTPVLLPGKFHGQRSLVGYSPWCPKESDTTERLHFLLSFFPYRMLATPFVEEDKAVKMQTIHNLTLNLHSSGRKQCTSKKVGKLLSVNDQ